MTVHTQTDADLAARWQRLKNHPAPMTVTNVPCRSAVVRTPPEPRLTRWRRAITPTARRRLSRIADAAAIAGLIIGAALLFWMTLGHALIGGGA